MEEMSVHECPDCKCILDKCMVSGCNCTAKYEGWYRNRDGFRQLTGMTKRVNVCNTHISMLVGQEKNV